MCECASLLNTQWAEAAIFRRRHRTSLAQEIADHLRRRIVSGDLAFDRRLPPIRKLASLYEVSVPTMHSAIHAVAALGLVRMRHGVGVFVSRPLSNAALLNHAWQNATTAELALMRAAVDERAPVIVARRVQAGPDVRFPRALADITFLANERSMRREGYPEAFLAADLAFHRAITSSMRGTEITVSVYDRVAQRLMASLMSVADVQATDDELDAAHIELAHTVLDGHALRAARLARMIARRELHSLERMLG